MKASQWTTALMIPVAAFLFACSSPPKTTGILAPTCGPTPVMASDLESFGFQVPKDKVVVMRIFATWCPFCKEDLAEIGSQFKKGNFKPQDVQLLLLAYKNRKEDKTTYEAFKKTFAQFGIPAEASQVVYVDQEFNELSKVKTATGQAIFTGWQGVPFGLVFAKDGRLAFRGHFTNSPFLQDQHYVFISGLTRESCPR